MTITGIVKLGRNVHIATGVSIFGGEGVYIGDNSGIGPHSVILTATDDPDSDRISLHAENELEQDAIRGAVAVGRYVLVSAGCVILPKSIIRDEVIVGALSLVKGELLAGRIYAGVPVAEIRNRPKLKYDQITDDYQQYQ